jgi:hypothetical protein
MNLSEKEKDKLTEEILNALIRLSSDLDSDILDDIDRDFGGSSEDVFKNVSGHPKLKELLKLQNEYLAELDDNNKSIDWEKILEIRKTILEVYINK